MVSRAKLGHYGVLSFLGKDGMGEVWSLWNIKLGRELAIKALPEEFAKDAGRFAKLERETKLSASLNRQLSCVGWRRQNRSQQFWRSRPYSKRWLYTACKCSRASRYGGRRNREGFNDAPRGGIREK